MKNIRIRRRDRFTLNGTGDAYAIALIFPVLTALGLGVGYALDRFFRTGPWLAVAGTLAGVVLAFVMLFEIAAAIEPGS